jgi:hypothetical protein
LPGHRIEGEARRHFGHAGRALGHHHEVDDGEDGEHHQAHGEIAADHELAERLDHLARGAWAVVAIEQQERGEFQRAHHVDHRQQDHQRQRDVETEQHVEQERRQRQHQHRQRGEHDHRRAEAAPSERLESA